MKKIGCESEAYNIYTEMIEIGGEDVAEVYLGRGMLLRGMERVEEAVEDVGRSLEIRPDFADAFRERASIYGKLGVTELMEADLKNAKKFYYL